MLAQYVFWIAVALVLYTFLGYPLLLLLLAGFSQVRSDLRYAFGRGERRRPRPSGELPSVSLAFAAYNEEQVIEAKMRNCAALDYPAGRFEVLVGCDGCTDRTAELARASAPPDTRLFDYRPRSGKPMVLNRLVPEARGEIVVFTDANTMIEPGSLRSLVRHFADPRVGCVSGELRLRAPHRSPHEESAYWRYEVFLKFLESRLNMNVGVNGALFAIRRELFSPLPPQGIIDDFLIAMKIRERGRRVVFDPEAVGWEESAATIGAEFHRRVRIGAGNFHALALTWRLLLPTAGLISLAYWSHKVCRWLVPFALLAGFAATLALIPQPFFTAMTAGGLLLAGLAWLGWRAERRGVRRAVLSLPYYFLSMNLALLLGFFRFLTGAQKTSWRRTARS